MRCLFSFSTRIVLNTGSISPSNQMRTSDGDGLTLAPTRGSAWSGNAWAPADGGATSSTAASISARALPGEGRPQHAMEWRPCEDLRGDVVEIEVQLPDHSDVLSRPLVDGNLRLDADLHVSAEPDDARVDRSRRAARVLRIIERGLHREFHEGNQAVERRAQADVPHEGLKIVEIVLDTEAPLRDRSIRQAVDVDVARIGIGADDLVGVADRHRDTEDAGEDERLQKAHRVRQIAEALAPEELGRHSVERVRDLLTTGAADFPPEPGRHQELALGVPEEDVLQRDLHVVEALQRHVMRLVQDLVRSRDTDAEIGAQTLGDLRAELRLLRCG